MDRDPADDDLLASLRRAAQDNGGIPATIPRDEAPPLTAYKIIRKIGEGGMGIVYEAEQSAPRRAVALKVLRPAATSPRSMRRFEYEAEILGRLEHPGIARILEAGSYDSGHGPQPWIAMEFVRGESLMEHVVSAGLDRRARLELFVAICDAVHHAHQKGIIHRDLKPGNILVDAEGRPKVLDFGIAHATELDDGESVPLTMTRELLGTLQYMSPEQVAGAPEGLDSRSDVHSLGAILFEMLAERSPRDVSGAGLAEAVRRIERDDPQPLGAVEPSLRGDLETIAAKAMARDRERRYASAAALAEDVTRHLRREPILARPPSRLYVLDRFARRNWTLVLGVAGTFTALVVGLLVAYGQTRRARTAEDEMGTALGRAMVDARRSRATATFLRSIIEQANPNLALGGEPALRDVLEEAARRVGPELQDEPLVEASVRLALGRAYHGIGEHERAQEHLDRAMSLYSRERDADLHEVAQAHLALASLAKSRGRPDDVEAPLRRAESIWAEVLDETHRGEADAAYLRGAVAYGRSEYALADSHFVRAAKLYEATAGAASSDLAGCKTSHALVRSALDDYDGAEVLLREALAIQREVFGDDHAQTANSMSLLGTNLLWQRRPDEAAHVIAEALVVQRGLAGAEHHVAHSLQGLGRIAHSRGEFDVAKGHFQEAHAVFREVYSDHPYTVQAGLLLARAMIALGQHAEAEPLVRDGLAFYAAREDGDGPIAIDLLRSLGLICAATDRVDEAETAFRDALAMALRVFPARHPKVFDARDAFGKFLVQRERYAEAEEQLLAIWEGMLATKGPDHPVMPRLKGDLVRLYEAWGKPERAAQLDG